MNIGSVHRFFAILLLAGVAAISSNATTDSWRGKLSLSPSQALTIGINITDRGTAQENITFDSPDQNAYGIQAEKIYLSSDSINITIAKIGASFSGSILPDSIKGIFRQGPYKFPVTLTPWAGNQRPQTPRPPFPYSEREVKFQGGAPDVMLAGTLVLPSNPAPRNPAVIMVTGSGQQNRDEELFDHKPFAVIADYLARTGVASLRYDDRGYAASTGDISSMTTADVAADAKAALAYLRSQPGIGSAGVIGHSEGASVAILLSDKNSDSRADFIVAIAPPAVRGDSILADQNRTIMLRQGIQAATVDKYVAALHTLYADLAKGSSPADPQQYIARIFPGADTDMLNKALAANLTKILSDANPWLIYFASFSPAQSLASIGAPALLIYGSKDTQVTSPLNIEAARRNASSYADIRLFDGLNHMMQHAVTGEVAEYAAIDETMAPEILEAIADYILKR